MARKKATPRRPTGSPDVVEAALALAAERRWAAVRLDDIAERAGVSLAALLESYPSKAAIVAAFARRIDRAMVEGRDEALADRPATERLFDVVMRRLDALAPYKDGLRSIMRGACLDTEAALVGVCSMRRSLSAMLEAARLSSTGVQGAIQRKGLALIYADTLRVWLGDDSEDMAHTMRVLDGHLRRTDRLIGTLCRIGRGAPREREAPAEG
jgi:AcrR family transcriptional regulator